MVLDAAGRCDRLADVCSYYAQLAVAAVALGVARTAVAIELREAPMAQARSLLHRAGLAGRVLLVRGQGLQAVGRADVVVVAGVGGDLAAAILAGAVRVGAARVVVQPNRHGREVRAWARGAGFQLDAEQVVAEGQSLHLVLTFARRAGRDPAYGVLAEEAELLLGPRLLASEGAAERLFLRRELLRLRRLQGRRPEFAAALRVLEARERQEGACQTRTRVGPIGP